MPAVKSMPTHMKPTMHTFITARTPAKHTAHANANNRHACLRFFFFLVDVSRESTSATISEMVTPSFAFSRAARRTRSGSDRSGDVRSIARASASSPSAASNARSAPRSSVRASIWSLNPCASCSKAGVPQCAASYGTFPNVSNALALTTQSAARYVAASSSLGRMPRSTTTLGGSLHDSTVSPIGPSPTNARVVPAGLAATRR